MQRSSVFESGWPEACICLEGCTPSVAVNVVYLFFLCNEMLSSAKRSTDQSTSSREKCTLQVNKRSEGKSGGGGGGGEEEEEEEEDDDGRLKERSTYSSICTTSKHKQRQTSCLGSEALWPCLLLVPSYPNIFAPRYTADQLDPALSLSKPRRESITTSIESNVNRPIERKPLTAQSVKSFSVAAVVHGSLSC